MRAMGVDYAAEYLQRFGFPAQNIVHTESLALGSASFTPMQVAARLRGHGERWLPGGPVVYQQN
ncbi:Penicillin-binding protein 1A [Escherichia coli]|uniref:Penicillin-binding protein 1A n=1 Tax=Escherichia coli TaxID=562 RepID=A0A377DA61_ECOLX|nr:Penicillin-binding protein 1A [Escherichia coli]